jgi:pimeloyl-ACP methyl ester carboxylesterase
VLVAPTYNYGDWTDPTQLTREATTHYPRLISLLDRLPEITGVTVQSETLLYGYSRGAQAANRFALAYPNRVAGVAMVSAGTYTIPQTSFSTPEGYRALPFPYGVSNMQELFGQPFDAETFAHIPFWIAVGSRDNDPAEVPQQWTPYVGRSRLERAQRFGDWLETAGCDVEVHVFEGVGHGETEAVRAAALDFLANLPDS